MNCNCISSSDTTARDKFTSQNISPSRRKAPLMMQIATTLGIRDYLISKFVFRKKSSKYKMFKDQNDQYTYIHEQTIITKQYQGINITIQILQEQNVSVPVIKMFHPQNKNGITVIYSHGNSSDLSDSFKFMKIFMEHNPYNVIIYDYTGYGASKISGSNQQSICRDLETVIRWSGLPYRQIILWGFSLGSFPTINLGSKFKFGGLVLHSPIASIANLLDKQSQQLDIEQSYDIDCLNNLDKVNLIESPIVIFHSSDDQLIPFSHATKIYNKLKSVRSDSQFSLVEVSKLAHNNMHAYLAGMGQNSLNQILIKFLQYVRNKSLAIKKLWQAQTQCQQQQKIVSQHNIIHSKGHISYFKMLQ